MLSQRLPWILFPSVMDMIGRGLIAEIGVQGKLGRDNFR
jgi:hypothetical protein